jgi:hypothetical protein
MRASGPAGRADRLHQTLRSRRVAVEDSVEVRAQFVGVHGSPRRADEYGAHP